MNKPKRTRRTKTQIEAEKKKESKGLGDTVENVLESTGVAKVAKWLMGSDCNCDKRKELLNKWFPYRKPNCLTEEEYDYLKMFFTTVKNTVTIKHQEALLKIYNRVFNQNQQMSSCTQCWKERINDLKKIYLEYEKEN